MWATRDEFQFAWRKMNGDFIVRTHVKFLGQGVEPHRKVGWIVRTSLDADCDLRRRRGPRQRAHVAAVPHEPRAVRPIQCRPPSIAPDVIQLERKGKMFIMSSARYGEPFTRTELTELDLGDEVYVGLFVCAHNPKVSEQAVFSNVRIVVPPKARLAAVSRLHRQQPRGDAIVSTGDRKVLHTSPSSIQAPNWTRDGKSLIYNGSGKLYRFDLATQHADADRHRLGDARTTTTTCSRSTARCSASATSAERQRAFGRLHGAGDRRHAEAHHRRTRRPTSTAGRPTRSGCSTPAQRNNELDIYKIPADGGDEIRLTDRQGRRRRARSRRPTGSGSSSTRRAPAGCRSGRCSRTAASSSRSPATSSTTGSRTSRRTASRWWSSFLRQDVESGRSPVLQARLPAPHGARRHRARR